MGELEVLIVDDEPMAAELHRMFVDRTPGFVVMGVASSGEDALRTIRRRTPDVVLLDLQLPGISGAEVLHAVRRDHGDAIEVIAVTADHRASSVSQMRMLGVAHYLAKPFSVRELQKRLRSVARVRNTLSSRQQFSDQAEIDDVMRTAYAERSPAAPSRSDDPTREDIRVGHPLDALRERADRWIADQGHLHDAGLSVLAEALHVSVRQLQRAYARVDGSAQEALRDHRVGVAAMLLLGTERIATTEVARRTGFRSLRTMRRAFQDVLGAPPSRWRAIHESAATKEAVSRQEPDRRRPRGLE
ncbi:response regulator [Microbacterium saperdae]|uniref:Response regulator of citrate/malate metabolism n=1 Tax=Microbacterium saperdae TaxID=69368 RepID=A0A543BAC8_9MICO|nr:response regulator [Microbacterium saperdae]TQL81794.1 response regulator of citrate/malate metabolism [Microbacterium saperdae]GGM34853.1 hypothetical protein GCM10010489_02050 [Microbacterium saperdae]